MRRINFIVGLPGSGKTYLMNRLLSIPDAKDRIILVDDPKSLADFAAAIDSGKDIIAADPNLCFKNNQDCARNHFESLGFETTWLFFENDPRKAEKNIKRRNDDRGPINLKMFSDGYYIPDGATVIEIQIADEDRLDLLWEKDGE